MGPLESCPFAGALLNRVLLNRAVLNGALRNPAVLNGALQKRSLLNRALLNVSTTPDSCSAFHLAEVLLLEQK